MTIAEGGVGSELGSGYKPSRYDHLAEGFFSFVSVGQGSH